METIGKAYTPKPELKFAELLIILGSFAVEGTADLSGTVWRTLLRLHLGVLKDDAPRYIPASYIH